MWRQHRTSCHPKHACLMAPHKQTWLRTTATPYLRAASSGGQPQCLPEEDGSVLVRDDLDALLEVRWLAACAVDAVLALQRGHSVLPES